MSLSEDEALLNSDDLPEYEGNAMANENSVTAIISEDSEEMEVESEEEEDEKVPQGNAKAFSDKDNKWLKLKKSALDSDDDEEEDEEEEEEEEMVSIGGLYMICRTNSRGKLKRRRKKRDWSSKKPRKTFRRI